MFYMKILHDLTNKDGGDGHIKRRLSRSKNDGAVSESPRQSVKKVGFIGMSSGVGTTTLVQATADCIVDLSKERSRDKSKFPVAAVVEAANCLIAHTALPFDKIDIGKHFAGRKYHPIHRLIADGKPISNLANISGGINWSLRMPGDTDFELDTADMISLVNNVMGKYVLCDISVAAIGMDYRKILAEMHRIVLVIDPLPSHLLAGKEIAEIVKHVELSGIPVTRVVNKMNDGANMKEVRRFIGHVPDLYLPLFDGESIYRSEFACKTAYSEKAIAPHIRRLAGAIM
jgi:hypothetical protein